MENVMYYAGIVEEYYNAARPSYTRNGYEKNVLIDKNTMKCIFVSSDVMPQDNELLFRMKTAGGQTFSTLKTPKHKKEEKTLAVVTNNRIFQGVPGATTWDGHKDVFVYLPDILYNEYPLTVKVSNLDAFLIKSMELFGRDCNPYQVLDLLDHCSTSDSPFGLPREYNRLPFQNDHVKGLFVFRFQHYEELEPTYNGVDPNRMCATFEFMGVEYLPDDEEESLDY